MSKHSFWNKKNLENESLHRNHTTITKLNGAFKLILEMKTKCGGTLSMMEKYRKAFHLQRILWRFYKKLCVSKQRTITIIFDHIAVMVNGCYSYVILLFITVLIIALGKHHTRSVLIMPAVIAEHPLTIYNYTVEQW